MQLTEAELKKLISEAAEAAVDAAVKRIYVETGRTLWSTVTKWGSAIILATMVYMLAKFGKPSWT